MRNLITDNEADDNCLFVYYNQKFMEVIENRNFRQNQAVMAWLQPSYTEKPKSLLPELQTRLEKYEANYQRTKAETWLDRKNMVQAKIDNHEYITEDSTEWAYRQDLENHISNFVWPSAEETIIREQEKQELLALLNASPMIRNLFVKPDSTI